MTYHEAIELIIKLNCEFGAIERLLKSIHEKKNKAEDELSEWNDIQSRKDCGG